VPDSPSYPSEHAAHAAAAVLAYFTPGEAAAFQTMAEEAGWSRVIAGVQYPSDYYAGRDLGKRVAEAVIAKAKADGSDAVWTGTVPLGTCNWVGTNPGNVTGPLFAPLLMTSASQFRPTTSPASNWASRSLSSSSTGTERRVTIAGSWSRSGPRSARKLAPVDGAVSCADRGSSILAPFA
jgi:hypothetical protein